MTADRLGPGARRALVALGLLAGLLAAETAYRAFRVRASGWNGAQFVWAADAQAGTARAFYLARDFLVPEGTELSAARLLVLADEEYQVHLNGAWIGGGHYRLGGPADRWDVSGLLHAGNNRLVVEARSSTGVGGVLSALYLDATELQPIVATGPSWRVFARHSEGLVEGSFRIDGGDAPRVLGRPPLGRWRSPRPGPLGPAAPLEAPTTWAEKLIELRPKPRSVLDPAGVVWAIDFGAEMEGNLELWSDLGSCGCALRYFSTAEERDAFYGIDAGSGERPVPPSRTLIAVPGAPRWRDAEALRFRHVTVEAPRPPTAARVRIGEVAERSAVIPTGPFGTAPPAS